MMNSKQTVAIVVAALALSGGDRNPTAPPASRRLAPRAALFGRSGRTE
jgi:hypothetical protein